MTVAVPIQKEANFSAIRGFGDFEQGPRKDVGRGEREGERRREKEREEDRNANKSNVLSFFLFLSFSPLTHT